MKLVSVGRDRDLSSTEHFSVQDIRPDEIPEPSPRFLEFLAGAREIGGLNRSTAGRFALQVRRRFAKE